MSAIEGFVAGPFGPWLAILAMAVATYLCRVGGALAMNVVRITPPVERALAALPGSIVAATVVPLALASGPPALIGIATAIVVTRLTGSELLALVAGLAIASGARALGL